MVRLPPPRHAAQVPGVRQRCGGRYNGSAMKHRPRQSAALLALLFAAAAIAPAPAAAVDPPPGRPLARLPGPTGTDVAFSRDEKLILTAGGDQARVWDAETYEPVTEPLKHGGALHSAAFSPDGTRLVTAADDGTARVWDVRTGKVLLAVGHGKGLLSACFGPDGGRLLTAGGRAARVWDAATGVRLLDLPHKFPVRFAAYSPDGARLFTLEDPSEKNRFEPVDFTKNTGHLWDARTGKLVAHITVDLASDIKTRSPAAFSADGKKLITAGWGYASLWDAATGQRLRRLSPIESSEHPTYTNSLALNADGTRAVTTYFPGRVQAWDAESGERVGPEFGELIASYTFVAFASGSKRVLLAGHYDRSGVWDLETGRPVVTVESWDPAGFQDPPAVGLSPDGKRLAVGFASDAFTGIWRVEPEAEGATEPAAGGKRSGPFQLSITSNREVVRVGEPVTFVDEVRNVSDEVAAANFRSFSRHITRVEQDEDPADETGRREREVPEVPSKDGFPDFPGWQFGTGHHARRFQPGNGQKIKYTFRVTRPGTYRFRSRWSADYAAEQKTEKVWKGRVESNAVELRVLPADGEPEAEEAGHP